MPNRPRTVDEDLESRRPVSPFKSSPERGVAQSTATRAANPRVTGTRANGIGTVRRRLISEDGEGEIVDSFTANSVTTSRAGGLGAGREDAARAGNGGRKPSALRAGSSSRASNPPILPPATQNPPRALAYEVIGVLFVALGGWLLYNALRPRAEGVLTQFAVGSLRWGLGIGALVIPILGIALGLLLIVRRHHTNLRAFGRGALMGCLVLLTAVHLTVPQHQEFLSPDVLFTHGGYVGAGIAWGLRRAVGEVGAVIALVAFSIVALLFFTEVSLRQLASASGGLLHRGARQVPQKMDAMRRQSEAHDAQREAEADYDDYLIDGASRLAQRGKQRLLPLEIVRDSQSSGAYSASPSNAWRDNAAHQDNPATEGNEQPRRSPFLSVDEVLKEELGATAALDPLALTPFDKARPSRLAKPKMATPAVVETPPLEGPRIEIIATPPPPSVVDFNVETGQVIPADAVPPAPQSAEERLGLVEAPVLNPPILPPLVPVLGASSLDDEMTPTEALEAQALATATKSGEPKKPRPQLARRSFGDGPLMPEYFDGAVRALDPPIVPDVAGVEDDIQRGVQSVQETLASFKIDARVTDVKRGPVITRYEVQPAPGVRVAAIANLDRDIARALSAIAVRIEAPVPGKNVVGIEVPNKRVHLVRLRDVLETPEFLSAPSKLSFVLGKDIAGQTKWADLTKMPHLLIAGSTNSGKSVCLNSIITSIIVRASPEEVKFSLIDPKRVELTLYRDIKHLYHPVVVEPKDAVKALRGAIAEMDRRYKRFAERGVRNIASYNGKLQDGEAPLPYLVIVIDELADLMMTAAAEFEKLICRLAQLARATGIHLIVATQRPSVNVITGVIKANIPARIAFAVASQVDSRTILDAVGAERLIGSGDMLFDSNNGGKSTRIQGAYLSEEEVNRIVDVVKDHYAEDDNPIEYGLDLNDMDEAGDSDNDDDMVEEKRDDLYEPIREFVLRNAEMSASMIQRKFEIGYPRAGRIVDQLERDGILSPPDGSKARKVIGTGR